MAVVRKYKDTEAITVREGATKRVVLGPRQGAPTFVMRIIELESGASSPHHSHDWEHEVFVLSGRGAVVDEEGEIAIEPHDAILVAPHVRHTFRNTGEDTFRFMCLVPLRGEDNP